MAQDWVFTMYKNILIATDGSELADKAVSHGLKLAKDLRASVTFVVVTEQWSTLDIASEAQDGVKKAIDSYEEVQAAWANEVLTSAANMAKEMGVPFLGRIPLDPYVVESGDNGSPLVLSNPAGETSKAFKRAVQPLIELPKKDPDPYIL